MPAMSALTGCVDDVLTTATDLNNWSTNIDTLCQQTTGRTATAGASTKPLLKLRRSTNQSIPINTPTLISWSSAVTQSGVTWSAGTPTQVTIVTAGWYCITAQVTWASGGGSSLRGINLYINGTSDPTNVPTSFTMVMGGPSVATVRHQIEGYEHLTAGATVYLGVYQSSPAAINLVPSPYGVWSTITWDAPY